MPCARSRLLACRVGGGELHEQLQPDEPLLRTVVQVTFQLPPFGIGVLDDPTA
jgi:hypothetical protein